MSTFEFVGFRSPSRASRAGGFVLARLARLLRILRRRHKARLTRRQLESLSDWQLKDLGLHRSEIWYLAHRPWLGARGRGHAQD